MTGGAGAAVVSLIANRRKAASDVNVATFATLKEMNGLLTTQLADVQAQLDAERTARRDLEDQLAAERRARRADVDALTARIAALERTLPKEGEP